MSALLFVRHGQTEANRTGVLLGRLDPPLNETGRAQIAALAERIAPRAPTRVLSSPLLRARESAAVIGARCAVDVEIVCSDRDEHRRRAESRVADIAGHRLPAWEEIAARDYRPWTTERIVIDTAGKSLQESVRELLGAFGAEG